MKFNVISAGVILLGLTAAFPASVRAQAFGVMPNPCCNTCGQRVCTCSTTRPVVETRYREQKCLTYQDRVKTVCKTEPYCVTVPVTKVDCVTVDEGCYQMVWVPKPVAKAVPRTEFHQRTAFRQVPVQVCEKVPVVTSHIVPEQTIRYVTEHHTVTTTPPVPLCPPQPCPTPCPPGNPCPPGAVGGYGGGFGAGGFGGGVGVPGFRGGVRPGYGPGGASPVAIPYSAMKDSPTPGMMAAVPMVQAPVTAGLVPDPQYTEPAPRATWSNVPSKTAQYAGSPVGNRPTGGLMVKAPTAASMFQTRRGPTP